MTQDEINAKDKAEAAARIKAAAKNHVKRLREDRLMSKAELARKAGVSALTVDRIEAGMPCRMDTKRKIILALGMTIDEKDKVFEREENPEGSEPSEQ
jgi:DNA-binding XRE family transcriptional regulator